MFRKIFISFQTIAFLNFIGCYSSEVISKKEIDEGTQQIDFHQDISINTKDYKTYHFAANQYQVENDSLYGNGLVTKLGSEVPFRGKIAMDDILSFEQSTIDAGSTIGLIAGIVAVGALILGIIFTATISDAFNPD